MRLQWILLLLLAGVLCTTLLLMPDRSQRLYKSPEKVYDIPCRSEEELLSCMDTNHEQEEVRNLKVAFLADQGTTETARQVLRMVKASGAELLVHQGDFAYGPDAEYWDEMHTEELGHGFPIVAAIGNHDREQYRDFRFVFDRRSKQAEALQWRGCKGVRSRAHYKGLNLVQVAVGVLPGSNLQEEVVVEMEGRAREESDGFLQTQLRCIDDEYKRRAVRGWTICSLHSFSATDPTIGGRDVELALETCAEHGAVILTAHAHTYRRFYPFPHKKGSKEKSVKVKNMQVMEIRSDHTAQLVVGLGGDSIEEDFSAGLEVEFGFLYCVFNPIDEVHLYAAYQMLLEKSASPEAVQFAHCEMRGLSGKVMDEFSMYIPQS